MFLHILNTSKDPLTERNKYVVFVDPSLYIKRLYVETYYILQDICSNTSVEPS